MERPFLKLAPERRLVMTFALAQALEILQMPQQELKQWLLEEIEKNPLLELDALKGQDRFEKDYPSSITLHEHIAEQIRDHFPDPHDRTIAFHYLHQLDDKGFIPSEIESGGILSVLQTLDPPGIFARSLQESLLLQLRAKGKMESDAYRLIEQCYDDLLHGRFVVIKKKLKVEDLKEAIQDLAPLSFRPARIFQQEIVQPKTADLQIERIEGGWTLKLLEEDLPEFHIQEEYLSLDVESQEEMEVLRSFKTQAKWIVRSINRRRKLLKDIGRILLHKQAPFFDRKKALVPITMKEMAEKLEVHESTLSRALFGKYVATPRGIVPLKSLITTTQNLSAQEMLQEFVAKEDKTNPLTDEQLADAITKQGVKVARRTISKYRSQLKIGTVSQRKNGSN